MYVRVCVNQRPKTTAYITYKYINNITLISLFSIFFVLSALSFSHLWCFRAHWQQSYLAGLYLKYTICNSNAVFF